jgi:hypothetical protein
MGKPALPRGASEGLPDRAGRMSQSRDTNVDAADTDVRAAPMTRYDASRTAVHPTRGAVLAGVAQW